MNKPFLLTGITVAALLLLWQPTTHTIKNPKPNGKTLIAFGDSLSYGTGAPSGMDYPSQLARLLNTPIVNLGIPGDTTAMALKRIDEVLSKQPRIVMITLGGNDFLRKIPKKTVFTHLEDIIEKIQDTGALVILGGINVPFFGRGLSQTYQQLAEKTGAVLIPNIYQGIIGDPTLMSDPIHPNEQGYGKMARLFHEAILPYHQLEQ